MSFIKGKFRNNSSLSPKELAERDVGFLGNYLKKESQHTADWNNLSVSDKAKRGVSALIEHINRDRALQPPIEYNETLVVVRPTLETLHHALEEIRKQLKQQNEENLHNLNKGFRNKPLTSTPILRTAATAGNSPDLDTRDLFVALTANPADPERIKKAGSIVLDRILGIIQLESVMTNSENRQHEFLRRALQAISVLCGSHHAPPPILVEAASVLIQMTALDILRIHTRLIQNAGLALQANSNCPAVVKPS